MLSIARLAPILFVLMWATGFIGARYAMPHAEPFTFLSARFALSIMLLIPLTWLLATRPLSGRERAHAAFAGVLIHSTYLGGVFWAISHGMPAGLSALIMGLQPLVTMIFAAGLLGEAIRPRQWLGLILGLGGVALVLGPKLGVVAAGVTTPTIVACIIAVVGIAAGTVWQKRFVSNLDLVGGTLWQYLGGAVPIVLAALLFEHGRLTINADTIFALAWLVLVLSLGAIFLLMYLIREGAVGRVASLFYLVPTVTALLAWYLFGETLNGIQMAGMAVTALGVALSRPQPPMRRLASR
jgi:drug/metabolite transporter (DMT)-like permease